MTFFDVCSIATGVLVCGGLLLLVGIVIVGVWACSEDDTTEDDETGTFIG